MSYFKKNKKTFYKVGVLLLLVYTILQGLMIYQLARNNKMANTIMSISSYYHHPKNLQTLLKEKLGNAYIDDDYINLENYLLTLLSEELNTLEEPKYQGYDQFYTAEEFEEFEAYLEEKYIDDTFEMIEDDLFYLKINSFVEDKTYKKFQPAIKQLEKSKGLMIDLRDNPGGSVDEVIKVLECFIPKGKVLMKDRRDDEIIETVSKQTETIHSPSTVILVNENTASASEILALCLKENIENVTIIGADTYGKGIATNTIVHQDGSAFMYVSNYWDSPNGNNVSKTGIIPDIYVEDEEEQFQKAMEILRANR